MSEFANWIRTKLSEQTELSGVSITADFADLKGATNSEVIAITLTDPENTAMYGGSSSEVNQRFTIITVAKTLNRASEMGKGVMKLNHSTGMFNIMVNNMVKVIEILSITLNESTRNNSEDGLITTIYTFDTISGD